MFPEDGHIYLMVLFSVLIRYTGQFKQHGFGASPVVFTQLVQVFPVENRALKDA